MFTNNFKGYEVRKMILFVAIFGLMGCFMQPVLIPIGVIENKCETGDREICIRLGSDYLYGAKGLNKDYAKAKRYFENIYNDKPKNDLIYFEACLGLGFMYTYGLGVEKSYEKAFELYSISCNGGHIAACTNIGTMYYTGKGVQKDAIKGVEYFKQTCDSGRWDGCAKIATHYLHSDKTKALQYLKKSCELGKNDRGVQRLSHENEMWKEACQAYEELR